MTLTNYWNGSLKQFNTKEVKIDEHFKDLEYINLFSLSCCVNSSALLRPEPKGSSTELAILKLI